MMNEESDGDRQAWADKDYAIWAASDYAVEVGKEYDFATSGIGSEVKAARPFAEFLVKFLQDFNISSMLEVSCGHWRSGWQARVPWPKVEYHGVDIVESVVCDNQKLFAGRQDLFGFASAEFHLGDMVSGELPPAELLLTKDTLIHLSFRNIQEFLKNQVLMVPPRYKHIMFVAARLREDESNVDTRTGGFHPLRMRAPPFDLEVEEIFRFPAGDGVYEKTVELLTLA